MVTVQPADFHFYGRIFDSVNGALSAFQTAALGDVMTRLAVTGRKVLVLYVILWGWSLTRGVIREPLNDGLVRISRLCLIVSLACNLTIYRTYIADDIWKSADAVGRMITGGVADGKGQVVFLDEVMSRIFEFGQAFFTKSLATALGTGSPDFGLAVTAFAIWTIGIVATAYAAFLLLLAKITLSLLLVLGPIAILCLLFQTTTRFFESWLGMVINSILLVALTAAMLRLMLSILQTYLSDANQAGVMADPAISQALPAIVLCVLSSLVFMQIPALASALGGGVTMSTLGAMSWTQGKARMALAAMRPAHLRRELNKLKADWRVTRSAVQITQSALKHLMKG